jgi:hypothetical protein
MRRRELSPCLECEAPTTSADGVCLACSDLSHGVRDVGGSPMTPYLEGDYDRIEDCDRSESDRRQRVFRRPSEVYNGDVYRDDL